MKHYISGAFVVLVVFVTTFVSSAAALSVNSVKVRPKPLPTPKLALTVTLKSGKVSITGGFKVGKILLPTAMRWSEQEFDASRNALPLNPSMGYQYVPDSKHPGQFKALTTAGGTSRTVNQRYATSTTGVANSLAITITMSVRATKTHKRASAIKTFSFPLGGFTAIGTTLPELSLGGGDGSSAQWSGMWEGNTGSATLLAPQIWTLFGNLGNCAPKGLAPSAPHDLIPASNRGNGVTDGTIEGTGYTVYGFYLACSAGYTVESQFWMRFGYDRRADGSYGETCELPLAGVGSVTVPPIWGGDSAPWATLQTMSPSQVQPYPQEGTLYYGSPMLKEAVLQPLQRTEGSRDICEELKLPQINASDIIA